MPVFSCIERGGALPDSLSALTVTQLANYIEASLASDRIFQQAAVKGEISNFKSHSSGHLYFTLKDEGAKIDCVMFRSDASKLSFRPKDGDGAVIRGRLSFYGKGGSLQIYARAIEPYGQGALYESFLALSEELRKLGYFDEKKKKALPRWPKRVAVVTSPTGAAIRDIVAILGRRAPQVELVICPVSVQGSTAPGEIASMIDKANAHAKADVLLVGRGGGSLEDLSAFNSRVVADAVYRSALPVVSAVGHETDFTICDMAADARAATPSAAAEMIAPDRREALALVSEKKASLSSSCAQLVARAEKALSERRSLTALSDHSSFFDKREMALAFARSSLEKAAESLVDALFERLASEKRLLEGCSHESVLMRGYAAFQKGGSIVDADEIGEGEQFAALSKGHVYSLLAQQKREREASNERGGL
jgi:exodeoxyribonuclease VII large subunit